MHRFFLPPARCQGAVLTLEERDSHHATRVLRLVAGDRVEVLDGAGNCRDCRVLQPDRRAVTLEVERIRSIASPPSVTLAPALLKGRAMDLLVQKATELGATAIQPLITERTVAAVDASDAAAKIEGWRTTAMEACKQCGNPWLPEFHAPVSLKAWLDSRPAGRLLVASLDPSARLPGEIFAGGSTRDGAIQVVLGPEGDLTEGEYAALSRAGAEALTLGPLVLRAETAAIAVLAVIQHELRLGGRDRSLPA